MSRPPNTNNKTSLLKWLPWVLLLLVIAAFILVVHQYEDAIGSHLGATKNFGC